MAAYAALVSLMHIIEQIQHHPRPPISLDKIQVESLTEKVTFLQDFLEGYSHGGSKEADGLESRIANAAYAAEDIIESQVVDQILAGSTSREEKISSIDFYQGLEKVIEDMDFIKKEVMEIKEEEGIQDQLHRHSMPPGSSKSPSTGQNTIVGFDDVLNELMGKLIGQQSNLQIIPIVGMGGIGKTTLARNVYAKQLIVEYFDIRAWVTISHEYSLQEILLEVLLCLKHQERREILSGKSEGELGETLHKRLYGWRYLIIMDDIWNIEVWDKVKFFFPDYRNGSRIVITTRLSNVAFQLCGSHGLEMNFLDEDKSWNLLCKNVFGEESCPLELEEIGKKIAKNCKGLPLSIVVIGGLLTKSERTIEYWEYIAENLNSIVNVEDNERCIKILHKSYNHLPIHLKPCFLYMGVFPEDNEIRVSWLIKLWVAEGFLKPINGKSLEVVAEEYLKDLIDRNLILVREWKSNGKIKVCNIHDLLRDLCLKEAQKEKFICVAQTHIHTQRRIGVHQSTSKEEYLPQVLDALQSMPLTRSLICNFKGVLPPRDFRLLRVLKAADKHSYYEENRYSLEAIFQLVNSRYLAIIADWVRNPRFPSSIYLLWNLQTLSVRGVLYAPAEFWKMTQLRHVEFNALHLPDPPISHMDGQDDFVLGNLQTLLKLKNFKCGEEVVKRIPNIKKLQLSYEGFEEGSGYCLNNLGLLHKLESLTCLFYPPEKLSRSGLLQNLTFPHSLKKLTLLGTMLHWEDMTTKIGSLPLLQVLKLKWGSFIGPEWETVEGQFCSLKFLLISACDLEYWTTDNTHFPLLEQLVLLDLENLKEIPSGIGEIPTLQSIRLLLCTNSLILSAKKILREQEELGNVGLQLRL